MGTLLKEKPGHRENSHIPWKEMELGFAGLFVFKDSFVV